MNNVLFIIFCTLFIQNASSQQRLNVGDNCTATNRGTQKPGICLYDRDCPSAKRNKLFLRIEPTYCGFQGGDSSIVCCVEDRVSNPRTRPNTNTNSNQGRPNPNSRRRRRISEEKCSEYSAHVTSTISFLPLLPDADPGYQISQQKCNYSNTPLVVGGEEADVGEFPHMALLGWEMRDSRSNRIMVVWLCGGSLISENFVLTAGHCTYHERDTTLEYPEPRMVRLGEHDLTRTDDGPTQDIQVARIIKHPQYQYNIRYHDIALIKMKRPARLGSSARPACLWQETELPLQEKYIATGWGQTNYTQTRSDILLKVALNIIPEETCKPLFPFKGRNFKDGIIPQQLCAGDLQGGKDTCRGDSGGPLQISDKENICIFRIVGITSFGKGCGNANTPAIYTRISSYVPWIESVVWP